MKGIFTISRRAVSTLSAAEIISSNLSKGSFKPPPLSPTDPIRIYSFQFSPFAQRVLLVLDYKDIPHQVVNLHLLSKPKWIYDLNEVARVPILQDNRNRLLTESLVICDYLEDLNKEKKPLYPPDAFDKAKDRLIIQKFNDSAMNCFLLIKNNAPIEQIAEAFKRLYLNVERKLVKKQTPYISSFDTRAGMVDLMIWPWLERMEPISIILAAQKGNPLPQSMILSKYIDKMLEIPAVRRHYKETNLHIEWFQMLFRSIATAGARSKSP